MSFSKASAASIQAHGQVVKTASTSGVRALRRLALLALAGTALSTPGAALASEILAGDYIKMGFNGDGTVGSGGNTSPGILYDGTGTGTFNTAYDYLTPGSPFEGFTISGASSGGSFELSNNNEAIGYNGIGGGTLTNYSGVAHGGETFDQRVVWTGVYNGVLTLTNDYRFNTDGQQLNIVTTIEAMTDLTGLSFARYTDPDAVAAGGDSSSTHNVRGATGVPNADLVYAEALVSKYVIGLYTNDPTTHNSAVTGWTSATGDYLAGADIGDGDNTIGLGFDIGALVSGNRITLTYSYIFGTDIAAAVASSGGGGAPAPEPVVPNINTAAPYTVEQLLSGKVKPVFDGGTLTLASPGVINTNFTLTSAGGGFNTAGNDLTINGKLSGDGLLTKAGDGVLTLTGDNSYAGLTISGGTVAVGGDKALGLATGKITVANNSTLKMLKNITIQQSLAFDPTSTINLDTGLNSLILNGPVTGGGEIKKLGDGELTIDVSSEVGKLTLLGGSTTFTSLGTSTPNIKTISFADNSTLKLSNLTTKTIVPNIITIDPGKVATLDIGTKDLTLSGPITGTGTLNKIGGGILTLNGPNTISNLEIGAGTISIGSQEALGSSDGVIVFKADTKLSLTNNIALNKSIQVLGPNARFDTGINTIALTGSLSGRDCFTKVGAGHLNLLGAGANDIGACVEQGQLSFNNVFKGNVWIDPGAKVSGSGLIAGNIKVAGILAPGNSPGRLIVEGAVTQDPTGTLLIDIDGPTPGVGAGHYDTLVLTGSGGIFTAGGTISPITRGITGDATNSYTPAIGDAFQVVTAEGGVVGAFATVQQPTAGMPANSRFEVVYGPKAVILAVTPERYGLLAAGSLNGQAAGVAVDAGRGAAPTATSLAGGLVGLNAGQLDTVLQQAAGEIHADALDALVQSGRAARGRILARIGDGFAADNRVWGVVNDDSWKVRSDAAAAGYKSDLNGVLVGVDHRLSPTVLVGAAAGYGEAEVGAGAMGQAKTFSYHGMAYAGWRQGAWYVDGVAAASSDVHKIARRVNLSSGALGYTAKPHGESFAAGLEGGRRLSAGPAMVTLSAGLTAEKVRRDAVTETGDARAALAFGRETRQGVQARLGGRISGEAHAGAVTLTPQASVFVARELDDARSRLDAALGGKVLGVAAADPGRTSVKLGAGLDAALTERAKVSLNYRYGESDRSEGHALALTGSLSW